MKRVKIAEFLLFLMLLIPSISKGQYYYEGHLPATTKWRIISANYFDLIFPDTIERKAQQLAYYLDSLIPVMQSEYSITLKRLPVILNNRKSVSNAFVGWAPSRMEFFSIPPQGGYAHDWLEQLGIHETTHWFQFCQMYQGVTGVMAKIFGEHFAAGIFGLYVPFWVIEGDAVYNETYYTESGRGREAGFIKLLRNHLITETPYSYDKAYLGSYKDLKANHYVLGYLLVAYGKEKYGEKLWDSIYRYVARNSYNPVAFYSALKKYTGKSKTAFYEEAIIYISDKWRTEDTVRQNKTGKSHPIKKADQWYRYRYPLPVEENGFVAFKESLYDLGVFVHIDSTGNETPLLYPGHLLRGAFSVDNGKIFYSALSRHPRWPNIEYADIWMYDMNNGQLSQITKKERLFSPVVGKGNDTGIFAIRYEDSHRSSLVRISNDGSIIFTHQLPSDLFASRLTYWESRGAFLFIGTNRFGKAIYLWDGDNYVVRVTPFTHVNIDFASGFKRGIVFHAAFDGQNSIYVFYPETSETLLIHRNRFGSYYPYYKENEGIVHSEIDKKGIGISMVRSKDFLMESVDFPERSSSFIFAKDMDDKISLHGYLHTLCDTCYEVKVYNSIKGLFRFHSWAPAYIDPYSTEISPGISFMSQNNLSTAFFLGGYRYDPYTFNREVYTSFIYKGFFPKLELEYSFANPLFKSEQESIEEFRYGRHNNTVKLSVPLTWHKNQWNSRFNVEAGAHYLKWQHLKETHPEFFQGDIGYSSLRVYYHKIRRMARQNLYPQWGFAMNAAMIMSNYGSLNAGTVTGLTVIKYLPGLFKNHGLRLYAGVQNRISGKDLHFNRVISIPKGMPDIEFDNALSLQASYKMPLFYPDFNIGPLVYIKRLALSANIEYLEGNSLYEHSFGFELHSDIHLLRHFAPVSLGYGFAFPKGRNIYHYLLASIDFTI